MPTEFHQFTHLPPELRNMVWEYTLPEPRVFDIYPASTNQKTLAHQGLRFNNRLAEPLPAISAVCRESRSFILHHYCPLTLNSTTKCVDLSRDILLLESCLPERDLLRTLGFMSKMPQIRDNLRSLAFGTSWGLLSGIQHPLLGGSSGKNNAAKFLQRLAGFPSLERVVFVLHQEVQLEVRKLPGTAVAWNGHLNQNATLYLSGTKPPPVKAILPRMAQADSSLIPEGIPKPNKSTLCTIPWTEDKPSLPHVNELLYYPLDLDECIDTAHGLEETYWCGGPWPTTKDFRRFKGALKRAVNAGVEELLSHGTGAAGGCETRMRKLVNQDKYRMGKRCRSTPATPRVKVKVPRMEGASLLWRYTLPTPDAPEHGRAPWGAC